MEDAMKERREYKLKKQDEWIKKFMKSSKYKMLDNEAGGDCLFATIRDAYKGNKVNNSTTIERNCSEKCDAKSF